jgi:DNA-binding SARP family transcriptional activator
MITLRLLGNVRLTYDNKSITLQLMQIKLLVALYCLGGFIDRDRLVTLLWDCPTAGSRHTLRSHVSHIRKQVADADGNPDGLIVTVSPSNNRTSYGLAEGVQCDADLFLARAREGADAFAVEQDRLASELLESALGMWGRVDRYDQFLAEVADCSFVVQTRSKIWAARRDAVIDKAKADIALGLPRRAAADLPGLAAEWPDDGEITRLQAIALYGSGKPTEAAEICKNAAAKARASGMDDQVFLDLHQGILNGSLPFRSLIPALSPEGKRTHTESECTASTQG